MSSLIKNLAIFGILAVILYAGYNFFASGNSQTLNLDTGSNEGDILNAEFLARLNELEEVNFSSSLFSDARFRSLLSFSTNPATVTAGRAQPFAAE